MIMILKCDVKPVHTRLKNVPGSLLPGCCLPVARAEDSMQRMYPVAIQGSALRITLGLACFVIIVAGMKAAASLIVPFLLAIFIAIICAPGINWLTSKGMPLWLAMTVVVVGIGLFGALVVSIVGTSIQGFTRSLPEYQAILQGYSDRFSIWFDQHGVGWYDDEMRKTINPTTVLGFVGRVFNGLGNLLADGFLIFLTVAFLLFEGASFQRKIRIITRDDNDEIDRLRVFLQDVNRYMSIKSITSLMTGILIAIWLSILGVEYALLWGLLGFLLNYIPNIGSIIAAVPAVLLALVTAGPVIALWAAAGYLFINTLVGNIIEPKFLGDRLGLSTLVVFMSLIFWGWILGTIGMFLSVPLTMVVKLALEASDETRWIAVLLGTGRAPEETAEEPA